MTLGRLCSSVYGSSSTSSQEYKMSDYLCEELIVEIFTRLPSKSLLRFKSLSKSLYSCIGSPDFIRIHTLRSRQKFLFRHQNVYKNEEDDFYTLHSEDELPLCSTEYIGITPVQFPFRESSRFVGICNGIFCWLHYKDSLSLWNPSIKRKLSLPLIPNLPESIHIIPWSGIGFGFDPISDDYKIVWLSSAGKRSFIYAVKTGAWCLIASPTPLFRMLFSEAFFFNGALHWVVDGYQTESHDIFPCIMTFDLSTHEFGMIPLPEPSWSLLPTGLTTIQGYLALISFCRSVPYSWFQVRRDGSWSLPFELKTDKALIIRALQPTTRGHLLLDTQEEGALVYNLEMKELSRVMDFNATSRILNIFQCVESLYLLDMGTACESKQLSYFGGKKTSKFWYLIDLSYYLRILFKPLFNMRRWFTQ